MLQILSGKFFNENIEIKEITDKDILYSNNTLENRIVIVVGSNIFP